MVLPYDWPDDKDPFHRHDYGGLKSPSGLMRIIAPMPITPSLSPLDGRQLPEIAPQRAGILVRPCWPQWPGCIAFYLRVRDGNFGFHAVRRLRDTAARPVEAEERRLNLSRGMHDDSR